MTMGDDKYYTIQIKGTAYRFKPVPSDDYERVALIQHLSVDQTKTIKALTRLLANSAGDKAWDEITDRWMAGELTTKELTIDLFEKLVKRQSADEKKAKGNAVPAEDAE